MSAGNTDLPKGWTTASFGDVTEPCVSQEGPTGTTNFTYVDIGSIDREAKRIVDSKAIPSANAPSRARQVLRGGDVLVSMTRPNLNAVAVVPAELDGAIGSTGFHVLRSHCVSPSLLYYAIQTTTFVDAMCAVVQGALYPAVRPKDVTSFRIPIPPLPEQRRIVAKVEELFSDLDAGVDALKKTQVLLKRYRQSVLKAAFEGKLTAAWRKARKTQKRGAIRFPSRDSELAMVAEPRATYGAAETAAELLDRIRAERQKAQGKKFKELPPVDTTDLPELPEGWVWTKTDMLFSFVTSGSRGWARFYSDDGALFLRMGNLNHDSVSLDLNDVQRVKPTQDAEGERTKVEANDILVSITADVGMIGIVPDGIGEAYINQHVSLARPVIGLVPQYLAWFLASQHGGQRQFKQLQRGATKVGLGLDDIRSVCVPFPPRQEQEQIVAEIERRFAIADQVEKTVAQSIGQSQRLRQSILKRAFSGRLVPQNPKDEPAEKLLERIRAAKNGSGGHKPGQRRARG